MSNRVNRTAAPRCTSLRIGTALTAVVLSMLPLAGCEGKQTTVPSHTCLIVGLGEDDPLWPIIKASAQSYVGTARRLKLKMVAPATSDPAAQADLARKSLDSTVTAVCLQSAGNDRTRQLVKDLTAAGTPVILIGQDLPDTPRFGYVGWDEFEAGKALATALKDSLRDRMTFMLLHADQASAVHAERLRGFGVGMQDYTFLRELHRYDCQASPTEALKIIAEQGRRYPQLGAWACAGDWLTTVPDEDLRRRLPAGTSLAMIGALPAAWPLLENGLCAAAVGTDYGRWGYEAVSMSELAFHRAVKTAEFRHTEPRIVHAEQLEQFKSEWAAWTQGKINPSRLPGPPRPVSVPR